MIYLNQLKKEARAMYANNILLQLLPAILLWWYSKLIAEIIDVTACKKFEEMYHKSFILLAIIVLPVFFLVVWNYFTKICLEKKKQRLRIDFYQYVCKNNISMLNALTYGEGKERINDDFNRVTDYYFEAVPKVIVSILTVLAYTFYIGANSLIVCITVTALACIQCIVPIVTTKFLKINYQEMRKVEEELTDYVIFSYKGYETIKMYDIRDRYMSKMKKIHKKFSQVGVGAELTATSENIMDNFMKHVLTYGCYAILGAYVIYGIIDVGTSAQIIVIASMFFYSYKKIFDYLQQKGICQVAISRLKEWTGDAENKRSINILEKKVRMKGIEVRDEDMVKILEVPQLFIDLEKRNLLLGQNGCGKSTLIKSMLKELNVAAGKVFFGDVDGEDVPDENISKNFIYMPQTDPVIQLTPNELFASTNTEAGKIAVEFGLQEAELEEEKIKDLSLGKIRKVFLSLALSYQGKCLILDEPTNHLDNYGEDVLLRKLKEHDGGFLIISHEEILKRISEYEYELRDGRIYEKN